MHVNDYIIPYITIIIFHKMGIRSLNTYLNKHCSVDSIKHCSMEDTNDLNNKIIVIDIYIYIYEFIGDNNLVNGINNMVLLFLNNNTIPIFIFDGPPPAEKLSLIHSRNSCKRVAEEEYNEKILNLDPTMDDIDRENAKKKIELLKRRFIRITKQHILDVKKILDNYTGVTYYDAPGEADILCAYLVRTNRAWACLSEDTDLFVYGCGIVIKSLDINNKTFVKYDLNLILKDLNMNLSSFREIMILSGTDYSEGNITTTLTQTLKHFSKYQNYLINNDNTNLKFYQWLRRNTRYISDWNKLINVQRIFEFTSHPELLNFNSI